MFPLAVVQPVPLTLPWPLMVLVLLFSWVVTVVMVVVVELPFSWVVAVVVVVEVMLLEVE